MSEVFRYLNQVSVVAVEHQPHVTGGRLVRFVQVFEPYNASPARPLRTDTERVSCTTRPSRCSTHCPKPWHFKRPPSRWLYQFDNPWHSLRPRPYCLADSSRVKAHDMGRLEVPRRSTCSYEHGVDFKALEAHFYGHHGTPTTMHGKEGTMGH